MRKNREVQLAVRYNQKLGNINTAAGGWKTAREDSDEAMSLQRGRRTRGMVARRQGKVHHVHMNNTQRAQRNILPHLGCRTCEKKGN